MKNIVATKLHNLFKLKGISQNSLAKQAGCNRGSFSLMVHGKKPFPEEIIQKMAAVIEVSSDEIKGWILADKYPENVLKRAIEVKQEVKPDTGMLILTAKIDEALKNKGLSRTALSKVIGYSQGKLNQMIKGDEPISPLVISKIAPVLEVSEKEIISWIIADRYSLEALRVAAEC